MSDYAGAVCRPCELGCFYAHCEPDGGPPNAIRPTICPACLRSWPLRQPNGDVICVYPCGIGRPNVWYYQVRDRAGADVRHSRRCCSLQSAKTAALKWWREHREVDHAD